MNIRLISKISGLVAVFALLTFSIAPVTQAAGITIIDERCVSGDGVVEVEFPSDIESFELTGPDSDSGGDPDGKIFSGLADGNYSLTAYTTNSATTVTFPVDCDPAVNEKSILKVSSEGLSSVPINHLREDVLGSDGTTNYTRTYSNPIPEGTWWLTAPANQGGKTVSGWKGCDRVADNGRSCAIETGIDLGETRSVTVMYEEESEPEPEVQIIDQRCVNNDGVIEFSFENVDSFKLNGPDSDSGGGPDAKTFTGLADGSYTLSVWNSDGDKDTKDFNVNCDKEEEPDTCEPNPEADISLSSFDANQGTATIKNSSKLCDYKVGIASYKGFSLNPNNSNQLVISNQKLFDSQTSQVKAGKSVTLDIDVPSCAYQIDAFYGDVIQSFAGGDRYGDRLLAYAHKNLSNLCGDKPEEPKFNLKAQRCVAEDGAAEIKVDNKLDSYKLINTSTGKTVVNDTDGAGSGAISFTGLPDGNYRFEGTLNGKTKSLNFTVDCDEDEKEGPKFSLEAKSCVDNDGAVEIKTSSGLDSYKLINTSTGKTIVNDTNGASVGSISFTDLPDGNYRFEGTLNSETKSLTFTIDCDEAGSKLSGECVVSDSTVGLSDDVTFTAKASGGQSPYSYSWNLEGSDDDANTKSVTTEYKQTGTYDATVTISDDAGDEISRTCSVTVKTSDDDDDNGGGGGDRLDPRDDDDVRGDRDINFGVQCLPEKSIYGVGEVVLFEATIDNDDVDIDDVDFDWSGASNINETNETATVQFTTGGVKEIRVSAEHDGDTETDTCYVQIGRGVSLDEVPYTGPGDVAKTLAFITTILLLALGGGYAIIKRREEEGIPVGIPNKHD